MSFEKFQGVVQTTDNSCGAFALAAGLEAMGLAEIPLVLNTEFVAEGYTRPSPQAYAQRIYQITGNLVLGDGEARYRYADPVSDLNPPSALACVAHRSGMEASQVGVFFNSATEQFFSQVQLLNLGPWNSLLDAEIALITPQFGDVTGPVEYLEFPNEDQVHLLAVENYQHWIVISNDTCYDSGSGIVCGYDREQPLPLKTFTTAMRKYRFSGLWVSLQRV